MPPAANQQMEALPDDLWRSILARLPVRDVARMRIICKGWKDLLPPGDALQRIDPNFSVNSIPAFLIQLFWDPQHQETWVIELANGGRGINFYKSPSPNGRIVVDACRSICFCMRNEEDRLDLSLCNPATRTWRQLPRPAHNDPNWDFNAMTFDATLRRCTVLLGYNNVEEGGGRLMVLEIYDSESNAWTRVSMRALRFIQPRGKGLYSNGKFYWIIEWNAMYFMVALAIAERSWTEIRLPEVCRSICHYPASLYLSGCDGGVVLIRYGEVPEDIRMWRLNDGEEWREDEIWRPEGHEYLSVVANKGWVMMKTIVDSQMVIYLRNLEQKTTDKISFRHIGYPRFFHSAFESNNVWWP